MPLPSGIQQPFDSPQGVKRQTKIQFLGGAPPPVGPTSEGESSPTVCLKPNGVSFDVFGPFLELIASTLFASRYMTVNLDNEGGFDVWNALVQIATGPIGFENIQIPGLAYIDDNVPFSANETGAHYGFPIDPAGFPAGVRVSARVKQVNGAQVNPVGLCINVSLLSRGAMLEAVRATVSGTITANVDEADIIAGGKVIIITLTNTTWVAAGVPFDDIRQDIIQGIESDITGIQAPNGWNQVVKDDLPNAQCVRTSDTVVTITLTGFPNVPPPPASTYDGNGFTETITVTVPASALTIFGPLTASPTFTVIP